jgi:hypothetical protein
MTYGIIQTALTNRLPLELGYRESSIGEVGDLGEGSARNEDRHLQQQGEQRSTELDWLLRLTWQGLVKS